jgi:hypothetical protein
VTYGGVLAFEEGHSTVPELARRYGEQADLARVLARAPGCARVVTAPDQVPAVAWDLGRPLAGVGLWPAADALAVVPVGVPVPPSARGDLRSTDAHWWVATTCRGR